MYTDIVYLKDNIHYKFGLLNYGDSCKLFLDGVFVIYAYKVHDHHYYFKGFLYESQYIYCSSIFRSKSKLACAIQEFLKH